MVKSYISLAWVLRKHTSIKTGFRSIDCYKPSKLETQAVFFIIAENKKKNKKTKKQKNKNQKSANVPTSSKKRKRSPLLNKLGGRLVIRGVGANGCTRPQDRVDKICSFLSSFDKPF
jgi:hypothetical protein